MLNSLVRVSRRDRWMAYNTPQIVEMMHRGTPNINTHSTRHSAMSIPSRRSMQTSMCAPRAMGAHLAIHGNTPLRTLEVYNRSHPEGCDPTFPPTTKQHIADRGDSMRQSANQHIPQVTRVPNKRIHNATHGRIRRHQPTHQLQLHPFTSERFHALLNSLFKVLFNFPSRYLFAIGLVLYVALDGVYHPIRSAFPSKPTLE